MLFDRIRGSTINIIQSLASAGNADTEANNNMLMADPSLTNVKTRLTGKSMTINAMGMCMPVIIL